LGKANEKKNKNQKFYKEETTKKIHRFANRIEEFDRKKLNKLKEIPKEFNDKNFILKDLSENLNENEYDLDDRKLKLVENENKNLEKQNSLFASRSSFDLISKSGEINSNIKNNFNSIIKRNFSIKRIIINGFFSFMRKCSEKISSFYFNLVNFVSSDHNKSFAYRKINWIGKYGEFPEEFQDNRIIEIKVD
jgi:hypothetical protein